jgi:hypothetical protein
MIVTISSHTSWVWVDLPVVVEWTAAAEQVEDHNQIANDHQGVSDVDANLIVPAQSCLWKRSAAVVLGMLRSHLR